MGRRIAAQWTSDPNAASSTGSAGKAQSADNEPATPDPVDASKCSADSDGESCASDAKAQAEGKPAGLLGRLSQTFRGSKHKQAADSTEAGSIDDAGSAAPEDTGLTPEQQKRLDELTAQLAEAKTKLSQEERAFKQAERTASAARQKQEQV